MSGQRNSGYEPGQVCFPAPISVIDDRKRSMNDLIIKNASGLELSMRVMDVLVLWLSGRLVAYLHFGVPIEAAEPIHTMLLYFCSGFSILIFPQFDVYESWRGRSMPVMFGHLAASWALVMLLGLFLSFLIHHAGNLSRLWLFDWYLAGFACLVLYRMQVHFVLRYLRRHGLNRKGVVIVGYGSTGQEMHRRAQQQDWYGYQIKAVYVGEEDAPALSEASITRIRTLEEIDQYAVANHIHEIWITLPISDSAKLQYLQYLLRSALVDIRWVPDILSLQMLSNKMIDFLGMPAVDMNRPSSSGLYSLGKDLFDKVFAMVVLILLLPLFAVIAASIKLTSPGPVFFRQPRLGLNGKPFNIYKFRTMQLHQEHGTVTQAAKNDPRFTRCGKFLRRTSLDELPQFINVLKGDMSVVGPRPHALPHNEMYKDILDRYMLRHRVKPGITGWAQIHGHRGETDTIEKMAKRVQFDLYYIHNWSFWLDLRIIVWTAFKGWVSKNAY
jgi:putative colanic acid biosysnthesis UDP-glucose lipid carrier transferase